jgi:hypothetical protein
VSPVQKQQLTLQFPRPASTPTEDIFTFLYLRGPWNVGRLGAMNGA